MPSRSLPLLLTLLLAPAALLAQDRRALTWQDVRTFRDLRAPTLSDDGRTVAWEERAETGDGTLVIRRHADGEPIERRIPRGSAPRLSADGRFALARLNPPEVDSDQPGGVAFVALGQDGFEQAHDATRYAFCDGGRAALWLHAPQTSPDTGERSRGGRLVIRPLDDATLRTAVFDVTRFEVPRDGAFIAWCVARGEHGEELFVRRVEDGRPTGAAISLGGGAGEEVGAIAWRDDGSLCAAVLVPLSAQGKPDGDARVVVWSPEGGPRTVVTSKQLPADHVVAAAGGGLRLGERTARVFLAVRTRAEEELARGNDDESKPDDEVAKLRAKAEVDIWHGDDLRIAPQRKLEERRLERRTRTAVHHLETGGRTLVLGDPAHPEVSIHEPDAGHFLATDRDRYRRETTWAIGRRDLALVAADSGAVTPVLEGHSGRSSLAPDGGCLAFWSDGQWHLRETASGRTRVLTADLGRSFAEPGWDYAYDAPPAGFGGWVAGGRELILADGHDLWSIPVAGGAARNLTRNAGTDRGIRFERIDLDRDEPWVPAAGPLLLSGFHERAKHTTLWQLDRTDGTLTEWVAGPYHHRVVGKARDADALLLTRERYDHFPDLHLLPGGLDADPEQHVRLSHLDAQREPFAWGTSKVLNYQGPDGEPLDAAVIVPEGWTPEQGRLPVLVYYYRFFSQRAFEWNQVTINHRPCFPVYASHGYAVFLPDIHFEVGRPGPAAVECLDAGMDALIEAGIADPDRIALHGHSWSGYQTAFAVTQTDRYRCAIAGAPVSNMTSAYGGIRWGSGRARQFQYERTQSRLGATLWSDRDRYLANSPLFFANRVETPLLILFGDEDGAVPWEQGIELYLALRRNDKDVVMLTYRGEPHHPQKPANKLDWAMRMKEYVDHHLLGTEAPAWMTTAQDAPARD